MTDKEREIVPGTPDFDKMVFKLNEPLTKTNAVDFNFGDETWQEIQDNVFVMPAYVTDDFNLFFIAANLINDDWVIAFSKAKIEDENKVTDLSEPMPTGQGLNQLGVHNPEQANKILKYFNTLLDAKRGQW